MSREFHCSRGPVQASQAANSLPTMPRTPSHRYCDPLELIWLNAAGALGWRIVRRRDAYASWDGGGNLTLAPADELDADDSVAQMILHEICHALIAGPRGLKLLDWGLDNTSDRDEVQEHAANRLQAALAQPYGLRAFFAVTTEFRSYYDKLPSDPLADGDDPAIVLAQTGMFRSRSEPYHSALQAGLSRTAEMASLVRSVAASDSLWHTTRARHDSGLLMPDGPTDPTKRCGACAWVYQQDGQSRCRQTQSGRDEGAAVSASASGCERWEAAFDERECGSCAACCHRGFDIVEIADDDPFLEHHRALVRSTSLGNVLPRPEGRCVLLSGNGSPATPYRCQSYERRPQSCRDFELRGSACLLARRRVGLSR